MEGKSRIVLRRSSEWLNRARNLKVFIDGEQAGTIANGESKDFLLTPGHHNLTCKVDWCSSRDFGISLGENETAYLFVRSGMKYYWQTAFPLFVVLALNFYYVFSAGGKRPEWLNYLLIIVALPALLYMMYYVTIGRKDYLVISKDDKTGFSK